MDILHTNHQIILGAFCLYSDRTAEVMTGKGAEREGMTRSKWAAGRSRTCGHRRGPAASAHGVHTPPTET